MDPSTSSHNQQLVSQTYAAAIAAGFDPSVFQSSGFVTPQQQQQQQQPQHHRPPPPPPAQQQFAYSTAASTPVFPQFSSGVPTSHPQQQHLHQLNMQHAAVFQSVMAQQQQQQQHQQQQEASSSGKKTQSKAERRAEHNAIERARRESLNSKFQQLAHALPNLQNDRRPSKGTIIERTLEYVKSTITKEERYKHQIRHLLRENRRMHRDLQRRKRDPESQSMASSVSSEEELNHYNSYPASLASSSTPTPTMSSRNLTDFDMAMGGSGAAQQQQQQQQAMMPWEVYSTEACSPMGSSTQHSLYEDRSDDDSDDFDQMGGYYCNPTPEPQHQQYPPPAPTMPMMMSSADYVVMAKAAQQHHHHQQQLQHHHQQQQLQHSQCMQQQQQQMMPEYQVKVDSIPRSRQ